MFTNIICNMVVYSQTLIANVFSNCNQGPTWTFIYLKTDLCTLLPQQLVSVLKIFSVLEST